MFSKAGFLCSGSKAFHANPCLKNNVLVWVDWVYDFLYKQKFSFVMLFLLHVKHNTVYDHMWTISDYKDILLTTYECIQ